MKIVLNTKIIKQSLSFSALAVLYIALVTMVMSHVGKLVSQQENNVLGPMVFLLLVVISVATMGMLIFGKPIMLYIDGKRREAVFMVICTVISLAVFAGLLLMTQAFFIG